MCPDQTWIARRICPRTQRGVSVLAAIFMLMLLAAIAALMINLTNTQNATSAQDIQGQRAYYAARAGLEWGIYQVMHPENTNTTAGPFTTQYNCPAGATTVTTTGPYSDFTISVTCTMVENFEGNNLITTYTLTSTASLGSVTSVAGVERQVAATVATCRQASDGANC